MKDFGSLVSQADLRTLLERFRAEDRGDRITTAELTERYNAQTAGRALTVNLFGRALAAHGINSTPSWDAASKKMARCIVVLDASGNYLPEVRRLFEADPTPVGEKARTVAGAPGLREGDVYAVHDGRLVLIAPADAEDVTEQDRTWLQGLVEYALENEPPASEPKQETVADSDGTLASPEAMSALRAKLAGTILQPRVVPVGPSWQQAQRRPAKVSVSTRLGSPTLVDTVVPVA